VLWGVGVPLAGALLGRLVPRLDQYILLLIAAVVLVSLVSVAAELLKANESVDGR
jgi:membrane-associated protein